MSAHNEKIKRRTVRHIAAAKGGAPLVCLTAYTAPAARAADAHADLLLVGDSLGMVLYGMDSTLGVTLDMMIAHGRAVTRVTRSAFVCIDMPFGSYQESPEQAFRNTARVMAETGAGGVKLEGGAEMADTVKFLSQRGIPVLGHVGLQPQSVHAAGGYRVMGRRQEEAEKIIDDAVAVAQAGAFAIVIECVDEALAAQVTQRVAVPTIGIGASAACDGQILVTEDMLGLTGQKVPGFVRLYAALYEGMEQGIEAYARDVRQRLFPEPEKKTSPETKKYSAAG